MHYQSLNAALEQYSGNLTQNPACWMSPSMPWHGVSENKKAGKFARSVLLHPVQRCYKFPIPLHPSSSNLIPFISQTPYIYLTGFHQAV